MGEGDKDNVLLPVEIGKVKYKMTNRNVKKPEELKISFWELLAQSLGCTKAYLKELNNEKE